MTTLYIRDIVRFAHLDSRVSESLHELLIVSAAKRWVRLPGGTEVVLHSEMELHAAACKPASAALGQLRRLRHLHHSQHSCIEGARLAFFAGRHRKLNVIDRSERSFVHTRMLTERPGRENRLPPAKIKG